MTKRKHYIRLLDNLYQYATEMHGEKDDWKSTIFNDITEKGTKLITVEIAHRSDKPAIGLCGDLYFCEAGPDFRRKDTIVVYRIESADDRHPEKIPEEYKADFIPISQSQNPSDVLDEVGNIFKNKIKKSSKIMPVGQASPELVRVLSLTANSLRSKWLPSSQNSRSIDVEQWISLLSSIWRQLGLERFSKTTPRQSAILNGTIKTKIKPEDFSEYLQIFNLKMLNAYVNEGKHAGGKYGTGMFKLLERMVDLPLSAQLRSQVWAAMASRVDPLSIRKEIKKIASVIPEYIKEDAQYWVDEAMKACRSVAQSSSDTLLKEKMEQIASEGNQISAFIEWAETIQFESQDDTMKPVDSSTQFDGKRPIKAEVSENDIEKVFDIVTKKTIISNQLVQPATNETAAQTTTEESLSKEIQTVEKWIVQQRMPKMNFFLKSLSSDISEAASALKGLLEKDFFSINVLDETSNQISQIQNLLKDRANWLPDIEAIREDFIQSLEIFRAAKLILRDEIFDLIERGIPPDDIKEIAEILSKKEIVASLPDWVWTSGTESNTNGAVKQSMTLTDPSIRLRISSTLDILSEIDTTLLSTLKEIPSPNNDQDVDLYLRQRLREIIDRLRKINEADEKDRDWITNVIVAGTSEEEISDYLSRVDDLKSHLSTSENKVTIAWLRTVTKFVEREAELYLFEKAIDFYSSNFGSSATASFSQLQAWINNNRINELQKRKSEGKLKVELTLEHNFVDHPRRRLNVKYVSYQNVIGNYGFFSAPVLFSCRFRPENLDLQLSYEINSSLTQAWPKEWAEPNPTTLRISSDQWRRNKDGFGFTFKLKIPVRRPKSFREPVDVAIKAIRLDRKEPVNIDGRIVWDHWDQTDSDENINLQWPDGIETTYVTSHPIGPQEHLDYIKNRVFGGSSFAIVAPRRFGKTTLAMYLKEIGDEWDLVVPSPVLCTQMRESDTRVDMQRLWETFSADLTNLLGASLKPVKEKVPSLDAFDHVRKASKIQGKKGILLILDEAQLFFSKADGPHLGNAIKDRLEREWSRRDLKDKAPLYFGFIGLPDILDKMGANLQGLLMPRDANKISHNTLNKLVYSFTKKTLHTTRDARDQLSRKAGNLFMLKALLAELVTRVNEERRHWFFYDDVVEVIDDLKTSLSRGERPEIAQYLRDILNDSEDVNFWKPRPCYPTAVAMAKTLSEKQINPENCLPQIADLLTQWCVEAGYEGVNRLVYTKQRAFEHYKTMEELDIIHQKSGFKSDILEAWLLGQSLTFPNTSRDRDALFAGALKRIRLPEIRESIQKGSQAEIFKIAEGQESYALRVMILSDQESQRRFHETVEILETLKRHSFQSKDGAEYIYKLKDIGIADSQITEGSADIAGVEIYNWIDGIGLEEKIGRLSAPLVAIVGLKLAKAVCLIHQQNILHRDICPRNIILADSTTNPVLIDFGLARFGIHEMNTVINSKYTAPEIRGTKPKWSKASDIFSLGITLQCLLKESSKIDDNLSKILLACQEENPEKRPDVSEILKTFEEIVPELHVEEKRDEAEKRLLSIAKKDMNNQWFEKVICQKIMSIYLSVSLGLHNEVFSRCTEAAQALDFTLEGYPTPENLKLTYAFNNDSRILGSYLKGKRCIEFLGALRNTRNHYNYKQSKERTLKRFNDPTDFQMEAWVKEGAELIGKALEISSLPNIAESMISNGGNIL